MQIEYSLNFLKALISTAAAPREGSLNEKFKFQGTSPSIIFTRIDRPMNALQLCRWQFSHKETLYCSRVSSSEMQFYMILKRFAFLSPPLGA